VLGVFGGAVDARFPFAWGRIRRFLVPSAAPLLAPLAVAVAAAASSADRSTLRQALARGAFPAFGLLWALQVGRNGSATNHCLPALVAVSLSFGSAAGRWQAARSRGGKGWGTAAALLLLLAGALIPLGQLRFLAPPSEADRDSWDRAIAFLRSSPGPAWVDYAPAAAVLSGKWEDATDSVNLYFAGIDPAPALLPPISGRRYGAVLLKEHAFLSGELKEAVMREYSLVSRLPIRTVEPDARRSLLLAVPREAAGPTPGGAAARDRAP
jgi:hypothetical protein